METTGRHEKKQEEACEGHHQRRNGHEQPLAPLNENDPHPSGQHPDPVKDVERREQMRESHGQHKKPSCDISV